MEFLRDVLEGYVDIMTSLDDRTPLAIARIGVFLITLWLSVQVASRFYTFRETEDGSLFYQPTARIPGIIVGTIVGIIFADPLDKLHQDTVAAFSFAGLVSVFITPFLLTNSLTGIESNRKTLRIFFYIGVVVVFLLMRFFF